jgi:hypothetical protein
MNDTIFNQYGLNVMVDTKPMFSKMMKYAAKSKGITLLTYNSASAFEKDLDLFKDGTTFFFGQVFYGEELSGTDLGKIVKSKINCKVFLVTVLDRSDFFLERCAGYVDLVLPKDMYWTEPQDNLDPADLADLKKACQGMYGYAAIARKDFAARIFWIDWMRKIEPSQLLPLVPSELPADLPNHTLGAIQDQDSHEIERADKSVNGWLKTLTDFFKFPWHRPTPA